MAKKNYGSVFLQEPGKYRGVLQLKDEFGVSFRKTFTGPDPKALQKRLNAYYLNYEAGKPNDEMKVAKMCELAIEACEKRGCAPKTLKGYRDFLKVHIKPHVGSVKIRELQPAHVERMLQKMEDGGAGPQTRLLCRNFLRMAINRVAIKGGYVATNAAGLADPPKVRRAARTALTPADLEKLLASEDRPMHRVLWLMLATTGL